MPSSYSFGYEASLNENSGRFFSSAVDIRTDYQVSVVHVYLETSLANPHTPANACHDTAMDYNL